MITWLHDMSADFLDAHGLYGFVRIFGWTSFRAVAAVIIAFLLVIFMGKRVIRWLVKQKVGDSPEFYHADLNRLMAQKKNTPTMGGVLIASSIFITCLLLADLSNQFVLLGMIVLIWLSILGGVDDWLKLTSVRRGIGAREGLYAWEKLLFQLGIGLLAGIFLYRYGTENPGMMHSFTSLPFVRAWKPGTDIPESLLILPGMVFVGLAMVYIAAGSNAVNITDGMDGLASGIAAFCSFAMMLLCGIAGDRETALKYLMPYIPYASELAVVAGAMAGACLGFLWYNCSPAQVFMGDTGSLPLGGLLAFLAVAIRQEFLLLVMGGIFFIEIMSVVLQVGYFKLTGGQKSGGRRIFRCAPIHHHFHLGGWTEQQVVVRFWVITMILTTIALTTIRLR